MTYFFIHTPKTSGTTFTSVLQRDRNNNVGSFYPPSRELFNFEKDIKNGPAHNLKLNPNWQQFNFISGHFTFGIHDILGSTNYKYLGVIREPVSHYISLYKAYLRMPDQFQEAIMPTGRTISDLLDLSYTHNMQTFFLSGLSMKEIAENENMAYEKAMENMEKYFVGIYPTDRFDEGLFLFKHLIGTSPKYYRKRNVAKNQMSDPVEGDIMEKIKNYNSVDIRLYDTLVVRFNEQLRQFPSIAREVWWFRICNRAYGLMP